MARDNQSGGPRNRCHVWSRTSRPHCEKAIGFLLLLSPFKVDRSIGDFGKIEISKLYALSCSFVTECDGKKVNKIGPVCVHIEFLRDRRMPRMASQVAKMLFHSNRSFTAFLIRLCSKIIDDDVVNSSYIILRHVVSDLPLAL